MSITPPGPLDLVVEFPPGSGLATATDPSAALGIVVDLPGGSLWAAPNPSTVPDALRLEILASDGTPLVPDIPKRRALSGSVEQDAAGAISFNIGTYDLEFYDPEGDGEDNNLVSLLNPGNLMRVWHGPRAIAEAIMDSAPPEEQDDGSWAYTVEGRGSLDILNNAVLYPEVWLAGDDRAFDYGSQRSPFGGWFVSSEWRRPVEVRVRSSFRWTQRKRRWPKGWPERNANWIWSSNPETGSADGPRWFYSTVTLGARARVRMWAAGDDTLQLKVDGNVVLNVGNGGWHKARTVTMALEAGQHVIAARVTNLPSDVPGTNRSGFAFALGRINVHGDVTAWLLRSNRTRWLVHKGPNPPGWFPPSALRAHVIEGQGRNVQSYDSVTLAFSDIRDSAGRPYTTRRDFTIPIGSEGGEVADVVRAYGYSVNMLPGLRLGCWSARGRDLRSYVALTKPVTASYPSRVWSRVKTVVLTHAANGWRVDGTPSAGLNHYYGRRETMLVAGGAKSAQAAQAQGLAALRDAATPEETIEIVLTSTSGHQPFRDFDIGDLVSVAVEHRSVGARVKAIAFQEMPTKEIRWTVTLYPFAVPVWDEGGT